MNFPTKMSNQKKSLTSYLAERIAPIFGSALAIITITAVFFEIDRDIHHQATSQRSVDAEKRIGVVSSFITSAMNVRLNLTQSLAAFVTTNREFTQTEFDQFASMLQKSMPGVKSLQLAPQGVVTYLTNLEANRKAIGHSLLTDPRRKDLALKSIRTQEYIIAGPINLIQGGSAIIARRPLYFPEDGKSEEKFWGFATVLIDTDSLFDNTAMSSLSEDYNVAIRGKDGLGLQGEVFLGDQVVFTTQIAQSRIQLPNASWVIAVSPKRKIQIGFVGLITYYLLGFIVALACSFGVYRMLDHRRLLRLEVAQATLSLDNELSQRRMSEEALGDERRRLNSILEGTRVGTWEWNVQTGETIFNERWAEIVGYSLSELSPVSIETWLKLAHPDDSAKSGELLEKVFGKDLDYYECEARMLHKSGEWVWVLDRGKVFAWTDDGRPLKMFGTHQDITERKKSEFIIKHQATHDPLTGLPNTRVAIDRIETALKQAKRNDELAAVFFLDLDGFKDVNDNFGHEAGDHVLCEVATRLVSCVREVDTVARIGGDEFLLVLAGFKEAEHAEVIAEKVIKRVSQPIDFKGELLNVGVSIGIAIYPTNGDGSELLLKAADDAMYATKKSGKNGYSFAEQ